MKTSIKLAGILAAAMLMSFTPDLSSCKNNEVSSIRFSKAMIKWKSTDIKLGEITQNKPVTIEFELTNVGEGPVIITSVQASCGCTSTNYSKTPIQSGETTRISAVFNAAAKGAFKKTITVVTNANELPQTLTFEGTVI